MRFLRGYEIEIYNPFCAESLTLISRYKLQEHRVKIDLLNISCSAGCEVIARVTLSLGSLGVGNRSVLIIWIVLYFVFIINGLS